MQDGFKSMSQSANADDSGDTGSAADNGGAASKAKTPDVDTGQVTEAVGERASELQQLLIDEIRAQPMRTLAWAAAAGVVLGFWAAK